jgi:branched-subunit amino acid aminotransferase/4-amino-4-deoxychorismate lyase
MSTPATARLYALELGGPRALSVHAGKASVHELFDELALGVYSALRTFDHVRFLRLEAHLDRTDRSLALSGAAERLDRPALRMALDRIAREAPWEDSRVRFDVLREPARALGTESSVLIACSPFTPVPERFVREGVRVELSSELRRLDPKIKRAEFVLRRRPYPLERQEAFELVMQDEEGRLLEGTSTNFHAIRGGTMHSAGSGVLEGITEGVVAEIAHAIGLARRTEAVSASELASLDEAFLTSSIRGIVPVVGIAGTRIGNGVPGPWTQRLLAGYAEFAEREARPAV